MQLRRLPSELSEKRELAYLFKEFDDIGLQRKVLNYVTDDEIADHVINFFFEGSALIYPPKSYFVAIVYAACMCKYFPKYFTSLKEPLMCYDLIDKDVSVVCDPTLLFTGQEWMDIQDEAPLVTEPYIFCYFIFLKITLKILYHILLPN